MKRKEQRLTTDIYWCKKCDRIQMEINQCTCGKSMEKIGFIDYDENGENK